MEDNLIFHTIISTLLSTSLFTFIFIFLLNIYLIYLLGLKGIFGLSIKLFFSKNSILETVFTLCILIFSLLLIINSFYDIYFFYCAESTNLSDTLISNVIPNGSGNGNHPIDPVRY
jgi:hypothetical protein